MKKLLKLLFVLSGTTTLPLTVIACGQESLDSILNIIYTGDTKYNIDELLNREITSEIPETFTLSSEDAITMGQKIAELIFTKNDSDAVIPWYDTTTEINQKCYNLTVHYDKEEEFTWDVNAIDGRFKVKISYLVGSTNSEQKFVAHQKIDKWFEIKCAYSASDEIVKAWNEEFNNKLDWDTNPLIINLSELEIDLPEINTSWASLNPKLIAKTNEVIFTELDKFDTKIASRLVQGTKENVKDDMTLKLQISINLSDAKLTTKPFDIKFIKE